MESYRTVKQETSAEFIEKRSKFIGYIKPVQTEEEAIAFIQSIKSKHWDATHNVYAYSLREGQTRRYSDDGEPQGTAGIPTLDVLQKADITYAPMPAGRIDMRLYAIRQNCISHSGMRWCDRRYCI